MIMTAVQRGNSVYVYNERNQNIMIKEGILQGYTSTSVSVKRGNSVYVYDDKGRNIAIR